MTGQQFGITAKRTILAAMPIVDAMLVETLSLPTPYAVGPVNAYVVAADPMTIIDAGVNTVDAENALKLGFAAKGMFVESIQRILVTHGHPDHFGLVPLLQKASGARAYIGQEELQQITDNRGFWELGRLLQEAGFPPDLLKGLVEKERRLNRMHNGVKFDFLPVKDGDVFEFGDFKLICVALPGHTGGHFGYLEPEGLTLFAGDILSAHARPSPLLEPILEPEGELPPQRRRSLKQYLESLDRLESMELRLVYPGHGPVITNPSEAIRYMREHHARRLNVVGNCLTPKAQSAFQLAGDLYPRLEGYELFLAVSEVIAHLDVLVEEGFARQEIGDDGVEYFRRKT